MPLESVITLARLLPALVFLDKSSDFQGFFTHHPGPPHLPQLG